MGQQPIGCRGGHAPCMAPMPGHIRQGGSAAAAPCRHSRIDRRPGAGGGISCAEGDSGPPRDGREPGWARPCEASGALFLATGVRGGHETCTLWPPPAPFGYFPVMEVPRPPAGGRNLHKRQVSCGRQKRALLSFSVSQEISPLRRRPKGFPIAFEPSSPLQ